MTTKADIIAAIQAAADASTNAIRIPLGTPGTVVPNVTGQLTPTGQAWVPEPKVFPALVEGIADYLDAQGLGQVAAMRAKVNELVGAYQQLKSDYNNGIVPTTAPDVEPLP